MFSDIDIHGNIDLTYSGKFVQYQVKAGQKHNRKKVLIV